MMSPYSLVLLTCDAEMRDANGFVWPEKGLVRYEPLLSASRPGRGLMGLAWGEGDDGRLDWSPDAVWVVAMTLSRELERRGESVEFRRARVVYAGNQIGATNFIRDNGGYGRRIHGLTYNGGDHLNLVGGNKTRIAVGCGASINVDDDAEINAEGGLDLIAGCHARVNAEDVACVQTGRFAKVKVGAGSQIAIRDGSVFVMGPLSRVIGIDTLDHFPFSSVVVAYTDSHANTARYKNQEDDEERIIETDTPYCFRDGWFSRIDPAEWNEEPGPRISKGGETCEGCGC